MTKLTLHEIYLAQQRIAPHVVETPLHYSSLLSQQLGSDVWLKLENRQHTGSFKPRGALNKILSLSTEELARGIVAASAGNHALGVAHAAKQLNLANVDVFVQANAAPTKIAKLRQYPISLHLTGDTFDEAQAAAFEFAGKSGATFVSAYDDVQVIAGQGTVGLEIASTLPDINTIVVPVGGGGLIAGIATVAKSLNPTIRVVGVNPAASPSAYLSKRDGQPYDPYDHEPTLAQGLAGGFGRVPFMVGMMLIDEIALVTEEEMKSAIAALIDSDQMLAEASGIAGLAAVLAGKVQISGKTVVVITGGNIDSDTLRLVLGVNESAQNQRMTVNESAANQRMPRRGARFTKILTADQIEALRGGQQTWLADRPGLVHTQYDALTYRLNGLAMDVHNELGPGHRESVYHDALAAKLAQTDLTFLDEPELLIELADGTPIHTYRPDFIVQDAILIELKAQHWPMTRDDMAQIFDYFAATDCAEALFHNFGRPRLDHHRLFRPKHIAYSHQRRADGS
ncbi:MAG: pyridoxal-phosphate dependent enzyme [Chloroflexi bacterium]|nr:pyridoxal-phosphate dependent enzyme [Chloroflexota bacterium]